MSVKRLGLAILLVCCALAAPATAGTLTLVSSRSTFSGADGIDWSTLGGDLTPLASPLSTTTQQGNGVTVSGPTALALFGGTTYNADFLSTDTVLSAFDLSTFDPVAGPITLTFAKGIYGGGAQIQGNAYGTFLARILALDINGMPLGAGFSVAGANGGNGDGSALFIGLLSDEAIYGLRFDVLDGANGGATTGFAINNVTVEPVPEPASLSLLALGTGLLGVARRRRNRA